MKSRQKITRVQLNITANEDYSLLGIVTSEPDYRLSLSLNKKLKISLKNNVPIEFTGENGTYLHFSKFTDQSKSPELAFTLFANKSGKESLLKKLNKIDYFLQVHSSENVFDSENIASSLRSIESITAVFVLNPSEIKDKNLHYVIP
jgi:hypothetical protein